jgi:Na+/phosphate symporter
MAKKGRIVGGTEMIQRYSIKFNNAQGEHLSPEETGLCVMYADHLEEMDYALKDAAGEIVKLTAERDGLLLYKESTNNRESAREKEIARLTAEVARYRSDIEISEAATGLCGIYATKDKQIDSLTAKVARLREALGKVAGGKYLNDTLIAREALKEE